MLLYILMSCGENKKNDRRKAESSVIIENSSDLSKEIDSFLNAFLLRKKDDQLKEEEKKVLRKRAIELLNKIEVLNTRSEINSRRSLEYVLEQTKKKDNKRKLESLVDALS